MPGVGSSWKLVVVFSRQKCINSKLFNSEIVKLDGSEERESGEPKINGRC